MNTKSDFVVREEWHRTALDSEEINRSTARAAREPQFRDIAIELIEGLRLPAFKFQIVEHVRTSTNCSDYIALFETLNPSIQYDDREQIRAAFEVNLPHTDSEDLAIPGRRETKEPTVISNFARKKTRDSSIAIILRFLDGHRSKACTAAEIEASVHPNGTGMFSAIMTSLDLRALVCKSLLDSRRIETATGLEEDRYFIKATMAQ